MVNPRSLTKELLRRLLDEVSSSKSKKLFIGGIIPPNVLFYDFTNNHIIFWTKPCVRKMIFLKDCKIKSDMYPVPALVYSFSDNHKKVFAYSGKTAPNAKTKLLRAPFYNVGGDGSICFGTAKKQIKEVYFEDIIDNINSQMFNSFFSHTLGGNPTKSNYEKLMKKLTGETVFPLQELIDVELKLSDLWKKR